jgi:acetyl-CoA C-acetyltransferase
MTLDSLQPVLVGAGQVNYREGDAPEPVDLLVDAVHRASIDSGGRVLGAVRSIRVVKMLSRQYPDPGRLVARRLGLDIPHTVYTTPGGQTPHQLVNRACSDIAAGRVDAVVVCGAESWRTRNRIKQRGERVPWSTQASDQLPSELFGSPLTMSSDEEARLGLTDPVQAYPMFEQALRARYGRSLEEQLGVASELWAKCSRIAVGNEFAAIRNAATAEHIRTPGVDNRIIGYPYTKLMTSNSNVDQAAALLLCSAERADALGVPRDKWVFLHGSGEGNDVQFLSERYDLSTSPAIAAAGAAAMDLANITIDDVEYVDLYSCFPSAVQVAAEALDLPLDRELSITGGLTFAGGPWNEYVVHALAAMVGALRQDPYAYGLVSANGGFLTKHVVGVWSCRPPMRGTRWRSVQIELDRSVPRRTAAPRHSGTAVLETYTVIHNRSGAPASGWVFALTDDGRRTLATTDASDQLNALEAEDVLGREVAVHQGTLLGII